MYLVASNPRLFLMNPKSRMPIVIPLLVFRPVIKDLFCWGKKIRMQILEKSLHAKVEAGSMYIVQYTVHFGSTIQIV
jgi:hypothetical protein